MTEFTKIHDLLREIDKALEQVRAVGARDADLSLKLPRAAQSAFEALCVVRDPLQRPGSRYQGIPITEWTDGPFMSFSLDHKVQFDPGMPATFRGKGVHDMVVELRNEQGERVLSSVGVKDWLAPVERFRVTGQSAWVGEDGVKREAPEFERVRIDLPASHEMSKATGGAVRGWDFGLVGERANPFPWLVDGGPPACSSARSLLRPSTISKLLSRRRKLIAKAKRASLDDAAVGSAIAAMNKPGRAHEL